MAQYEQTVTAATENVTSGLSTATTTAITEILAAATGGTDGAGAVAVQSIAAGEAIPAGLDIAVIQAGVIVDATDAKIIQAAPGVALAVTSLAPTGATRAVLGGDEPDSIVTTASSDLPRQAGTASDDDTIVVGGGGNDTITTGSGNDSVTGGTGNDSISTGAGNDVITIGSGADTIDAGSGIDVIISTQKSTEVDISIDAQGKITLTDKTTGDVTTIDNAEYLEFSDNVSQLTTSTDVDLLVDSSLGKAFALEVSQGGLKAFDALSAGSSSVSELVSSYVTSDAFKTSSTGVTDIDILANLVYKGVFGVDAGGETLKLWSTAIKTGLTSADTSTTSASANASEEIQIIGASPTTVVSFDEI